MNTSKPKPQRFCDMVMKGGITSGVVYPLAITRLAQEFTFKQIGGTSAGAIAAAAAAAAELARERGGFEKLAELPKFLSGKAPDGSGNSNLMAFFQPQPQTRRLFRVLSAALGDGSAGPKLVCAALFRCPLAAVLGAAPGALLGWMVLTRATGAFLWVGIAAALLLLLGGVAITVVWRLWRDATHGLPGNFYGLCSGMTDEFYDVKKAPEGCARPLTFWLHEYLNEFVGRDAGGEPLTFGELKKSDITLEMMTTCLTHGRPYRLPFRHDEVVHENRLYFRRDEFDLLFPKSVVDWMVDHPRQTPGGNDEERAKSEKRRAARAEAGFHALPDSDHLPVIVATRMSLSFPILLSAVPLHGINYSLCRDGSKLERCWFTDGGVCSNFPVHFFDSPLPRWPTLSLDLVANPEGTSAEELLVIKMARDNGDSIAETWNRFECDEKLTATGLVRREKTGGRKLAGFIGSFISTMQNWTDSTQSRLPGFRDRIAPVGLTPKEGGLNLNMPAPLIEALAQRGKNAAEEFIARFGAKPANSKMNWENHRWLRMRSCLASLEDLLQSIHRACEQPQVGDIKYEQWLQQTPPGKSPGYAWREGAAEPNAQRDLALAVLRGINDLAKLTDPGKMDAASLTHEAPKPRPELRPRARI